MARSWFASGFGPGQWICWDFREMRVRLTHYTLWTAYLKSWVVEGSLDGARWTEIDRQTDNQDFTGRNGIYDHDWNTASFRVSRAADFRLIRLKQTDQNHTGNHTLLPLRAVEFFGAFSE
jgi:hypothetical protein